MDKRFQWSRKLEDGTIYVVVGDERKQFEDDIIYIKGLITNQRTDKPLETQPERASEPSYKEVDDARIEAIDKRAEEPDELEGMCEVHEVMMKERMGKNGKFYSHSKGQYPDLQWCSGQGFKE